MDLPLINVQWLRVSQLCCLSSLLSPLLPVEGSLDLPSDAAPLRPNTFIRIENTNGHSQHGKVLIRQPFSGSWLSDLLQHWLRTRLKCSPTIPHRGVLQKEGFQGTAPRIARWQRHTHSQSPLLKIRFNHFILQTGESIPYWGPLLSHTILLKEFYWDIKM